MTYKSAKFLVDTELNWIKFTAANQLIDISLSNQQANKAML